MKHAIEFEPNLAPDDGKIIRDGLIAHGAFETGWPLEKISSRSFAFVVRDEGAIRAGLVGRVWHTAALFDTLWVDESLRKQGIGRALLERAEDFAKSQGCVNVFLDTLSPGNIRFYEKSGYVREFSRPNYVGDLSMHYFRKTL